MTQTFESGFKTTLAAKLTAAATSMVVTTAPTVTAGRLFLKSGTTKERISYTGVTGTTLTGLTRGLSQTADPSTTGTGSSWLAGTEVILVAMHDQLSDKQEGLPAPVFADDTARDARLASPTNGMQCYNTADGKFQDYTAGSWVDRESGGTFSNASTTVAGKVEVATSAETKAGTDTGGTGAKVIAAPSDIAANEQSATFVYAADAGANDTYVIALTPTLTALTTGQRIRFKANTINTGAATLNVDSLGAKTIKKRDGNDLANGDIAASDIVDVVYDGTNFVLQKTTRSEFSTFGGDGSDGAVAGALTITGTNNTYITKNYTSFTPGAETVTITPTGCILHIKVQGDADLSDTTFTFTGKGTPGGAQVAGGGTGASGTVGNDSINAIGSGIASYSKLGAGGDYGDVGVAAGTGGAGGTIDNALNEGMLPIIKGIICSPGAGGGSGGGGAGGTSNGGTGGAGGAGGGCVILEVAGDLTFSSTTVNCDGVNGSAGGNEDSNGAGGGGGGGGGGGMFVAIYGGTLTSTPTTDIGGGTAGAGGSGSNDFGGGGGGGGGSLAVAGSDGSAGGGTSDGGAGGAGGDGLEIIIANTFL